MRWLDIPFLAPDILRWKSDIPLDPADWPAGTPVQLRRGPDDTLQLIHAGVAIVGVIPEGEAARRHLSEIEAGRCRWVLESLEGSHTFLVRAYACVDEFGDFSLSIGVDAAAVRDLEKRGVIAGFDEPAARAWLHDTFCIEVKPAQGGTPARTIIFLVQYENTSREVFQLIGRDTSGRVWRADIRRSAAPSGGGTLLLQKINISKGNPLDLLVTRAEGAIRFEARAVLSETEQAQLDAALRSHDGYLQLWRDYAKLEWEQAITAARDIGVVSYQSNKKLDEEIKGWRLAAADRESWDKFKAAWLGSEDAQIAELTAALPDFNRDPQEAKEAGGGRAQLPRVRGKLSKWDATGVVFSIPDTQTAPDIPPSGYISLSLAGDETVQLRRARAQESLRQGRRLPSLAAIMSDVPIGAVRPGTKISASKGDFGERKPNPSQFEALEVALNTPDIAVIIGPPGTGKTQVIAALQRRLAEEAKRLNKPSLLTETLVTSFQHDAVDNALERTRVYGLPALRVGGKGAVEKAKESPISRWCAELCTQVENTCVEREKSEPWQPLLRDLFEDFCVLRGPLAPAERHERYHAADASLRDLVACSERFSLPLATQQEWNRRLEMIPSSLVHETFGREMSTERKLRRRLYALRVTTTAFADDGPDRAADLLASAEKHAGLSLDKPALITLRTAADLFSEETPEPDLLAELARIQDRWQDRIRPDYRPPEIKSRPTEEEGRLLDTIGKAIETAMQNSRLGVTGVLRDYLTALESDPERIEDTVERYTAVVGATCQQAAGKAMMNLQDLHRKSADTQHLEFESVIIDEAARANPLDLFVPMAMAKRRVILVGDDKQLPHLLEPDLEAELTRRQNLTDAHKKAYRQSLFERVKHQLEEQYPRDGIRRVVMLDTQYRMHPVLGAFISGQFYQDALKSGRPPEDFIHRFPGYEGRVAAWLDVPVSAGGEGKSGTSRIRRAEATTIAGEVKRLADAEPDRSIGVISFYRAQADEVMEQLAKLGVAERDANTGRLDIAANYRRTSEGEERIRIGTVDAFQGKEFDAVFLSVVRTGQTKRRLCPDDEALDEAQCRERELNARYGHLRSANRLNVAMSRQRRLLVAVGARTLVESPEAESPDAIPALVAFNKLCSTQAGPHV